MRSRCTARTHSKTRSRESKQNIENILPSMYITGRRFSGQSHACMEHQGFLYAEISVHDVLLRDKSDHLIHHQNLHVTKEDGGLDIEKKDCTGNNFNLFEVSNRPFLPIYEDSACLYSIGCFPRQGGQKGGLPSTTESPRDGVIQSV